jgi:hypothetical protein
LTFAEVTAAVRIWLGPTLLGGSVVAAQAVPASAMNTASDDVTLA